MNPLPRTTASFPLGRTLVAPPTDEARIASSQPPRPTCTRGRHATAQDRDAGGVGSTLRWVVVAGFGQMIFFGLLFLAFCARAETAKPAGSAKVFPPPLKESAYQPQRTRDPFITATAAEAGVGGATVESTPAVLPGELRLQGILLDPRAPSAVINDRVVERGKPVTLRTGTRELTVVVEQILRETVVLRVGEQTVTLRLGANADPTTPRQGGIQREP